jgi:hypothetical protein
MTPDIYRHLCDEFPLLASGERLSPLEARMASVLAAKAHARVVHAGRARGAGGPATSVQDARDAWVAQIRGTQPLALLIGEAPGPKSDPSCPLFPFPPRSSGARLLELAGYAQDPLAYLSYFARADVVAEFPLGTWPRAEAVRRMTALVAWAAGLPIIMLGARAANALGLVSANTVIPPGCVRAEHYRWMDATRFVTLSPLSAIAVAPSQAAQPVIWLPHPSGRNRLTSMAGAQFMDAFRLARTIGMDRREEAIQRRLRTMTAAAGAAL